MINLRQVRSLLAVVEAGSVNRAAEQLCLAPSSVSAQLKELSSGLGVSLFDSAGRGLVLSAAGRELLPRFQHLLSINDEITSQAQALLCEPAGELRLYAPSSMCIYRLPVLIESLQSVAPGIELHLQHDPLDYRQAMSDRSIEAAIVVVDKSVLEYHQEDIAREDVIYVAHPDLIVKRKVTLAQLSDSALITTEPGCSYRVAAETHFRECGVRFSPRQSFSNVEVIRRCLLAKMGVGLLPRCVVDDDITQGRLQEQKVKGAPYRFMSAVIWPREARVSARLSVFLRLVREQRKARRN